ncbi:MAG: chlorophyllase, partial [Lachnospiraceae bacterium]|nr:chlorophyllase [Lachnospiraceae bacterium]
GLAVGLTALIVKIGSWILRICLYRGEKHLIVLVILFSCIYFFCMFACMDIVTGLQGGIAAVVVFVSFILFARSLYAIVRLKRKSLSVFIICIVSGLCTLAILVITIGSGFEDSYVKEYIKLRRTESLKTLSKPALTESELQNGNEPVGVLEYGAEQKRVKPPEEMVEDDLESTSADLEAYVDGYSGLSAKYRELYLGYDIHNVPLAGRIWYPKRKEHCPVLFILHGNHDFTSQSYLGYAYLGEYLASHGYVVVSVDENFCNGNILGDLTEENDARAVLLLENIGEVLTYNKTEGNPLFGKIDEEKIAIAGHSRGGEAAAVAAYFNTLSRYPENGTISFDYQYAIQSVIAIAPTADQYRPMDRSTELKDISYLLLQGANDQDISVFMGLKQYNSIQFTKEKDCLKSYLYIAGSNHGQFNTEWGRYDIGYPLSRILNVKNLLLQEDQQQILQLFTKKFLDVTLKGDQEGKSLFYDVQAYQSVLPETVYIQGYADSTCETVCDFEEDLDLTTGTMEGSVINTGYAEEWTEKLSRFTTGTYHFDKKDYALSLKWKETYRSYVRVHFPSFDATDKKLTFDILDMDNANVREEAYRALNCTILLKDQNGRRAQTTLGEHCTVYPPLPVRLSKLQFLFGENEYKHQFQTVLIPVSAFEGEEGFDASAVTEIRFCFDKEKSGSIRLDDVGFTE